MHPLLEAAAFSFLHSLWQSALLYGFCMVILHRKPQLHPLNKRNLAVSFLAGQLLISLCTFLFYYVNYSAPALSIAIYNPLDSSSLRTLAIVYCCIVGLRVAYLLHNWISFKQKIQTSFERPPADWRFFTKQAAHRLGCSGKTAIWLSKTAQVPFTYGFWQPVIVLPFSLLNDLSMEEIESIILHELAHIKQNDFIINIFVVVCETLYIFNPFIFLLGAVIKREREFSCDWQVCAIRPKLSYAEALLKVARRQQQALAFQLAAVQQTQLLHKRILAFSSTRPNPVLAFNYALFTPVFITFLLLIQWSFFPLSKIQNTAAVPFHKIQVPGSVMPNAKPALAYIAETEMHPGEATITSINSKLTTGKKILPKQPAAINQRLDGEKWASEEEEQIENWMPVTYNPSLDSAREVIITEQSSGGKSVTKSYKLSFSEGKWKMTLLWVIEDVQQVADSAMSKRNEMSKPEE